MPLTLADLTALAQRLKARETAAFETLLRTLGPRLLDVARRYVGPDEAEDCLQEAMIASFSKIDTLERPERLEAWLRRIVINAALTRIRARSARKEAPIDHLMPAFDARDCRIEPDLGRLPTPEALLADRQSALLVREAVTALPENHRTILMLRDFEGYSTQEAADMLGIEYTAAKVRLHRARAALKKKLEPLMGDRS